MPRDELAASPSMQAETAAAAGALPAALASLVQMISSEVAHEMQAEEASSSSSSPSDLASRVLHRAQDWPRTHAQFHKLDVINSSETEADTEQQLAGLLQRLDRMQRPPSPASSAAAAASSASTVAAAASSAVAALPAPSSAASASAYVSSISSTAGFHSLFSSAALPSYDSLLDCCVALSYQPLVGAPSHLALLNSALEMPLGDILASPQWSQVLDALAGCVVWGRQCESNPAVAAAIAANAAASAAASATSPTPQQQQGRAASRKKSQGASNSSHSSHSHKKSAAAAASSKSKASQPPTIPVPVHAPAPDVRDQFLLACTALKALQGLYEAAEGSVQTAEIYLALLGALKSMITRNSHAAAGADGAISFLSVLPSSASEILPLPPALFLSSLWFHASRLWNHMAHSVLDLSPHFSDEVLSEVVSCTGEIVGSMLSAGSASSVSSFSAASSSSNSSGSGSSLFWTLFGMQDPRAIWLRKWVSQFAIRSLWHRSPVAAAASASVSFAGAARKAEQQPQLLLPRSVEDALRTCKEYAVHLALNPPGAPSAAAFLAASPGVLTLSAAESHALAHTAAFGFLFEHLTSWLPPLPVTPASAPAPVTVTVTAAAKGASRGKKAAPAAASPSSKQAQSLASAAAAAALPVVSCAVHDADQSHAETMRSLRDLASHMLLAAALNFAPLPTTSDAASSPTATPPLLVRTRLTLLSCCHRFLAHSASSPDALDSEAIAKEATWTQSLLQRSFHALFSGGAVLREAQVSSREYFSKLSQALSASNAAAAAVALSPTSNGGSGKKGFGASTQPNRSKRGAGSTEPPAKPAAGIPDDKRRAIEPVASSSSSSVSGDGPSTTLVQQAALTAILGLALEFAQRSPQHRAALVERAQFPAVSSSSPDNEEAATISLQHFLCQLLGFDDASSAATGNARRRFEFFDGVGAAAVLAIASSPDGCCILALPSALESMMVDLLRQCIVPASTRRGASAATSSLTDEDSELQFRCIHGLPSMIEGLVVTLPPSLQEAASEAATATSNEQDAAAATSAIAHQHSPRLTMLLDLLSHWSCALSGGWDRLHASHQQLVDLCARRFVLSLRTQQPNETCLPWCARCLAATSSTAASFPSPPDSFLAIQACSRALRHMVQSGPTFRALVRHGLVHDLLSRLASRLREEEGRWGLAFELDSSSVVDRNDDPEQEEEEGLWSLRMLITALGHTHARALIDEEIQLLQSSSASSAASAFVTAPRPPLFLMLSALVRSWVALEDFIDDEAIAAAGTSNSVDGTAAAVAQLSLNGGSSSTAMHLPLSFSPLIPPFAASSLPSSWSGWLSSFCCVASSSNAQEIGLRLLCGLVRGEKAFAERMARWWNIEAIVRATCCSSSCDGQEIEDQSSRWRRTLLAAIASAQE